MKEVLLKISFILVVVWSYGCDTKTEKKDHIGSVEKESGETIITDTLYVSADDLEIQTLGGKGLYNGELFTGYATRTYANDQLSEKIFYLSGKKEGEAKYWFENGSVKKTKQFVNNKLNGTTVVYFSNGKKVSIKNYVDNRLDGEQKTWYRSGQLYRHLNYVNGKANGLQQAWLENGKKYANYEARNGRNFGLNRMDVCFGLSDEKIGK